MFSTCCYFCWFSDPLWHPAGAEWDENGAKNWSFGLFFDTISTHAAKKPTTSHNPQPTTPRTFFFVTLAPKPKQRITKTKIQKTKTHTLTQRGPDKICQRSAKIKQDQPKDRQAFPCKRHLPKQNTKTPSPKMRGRRCHAAWRLQSAPGPWAPEACLTRKLHSLSIILVFFLGYILSGGFFDDKLGVRGVTPPCAQTPFSASIFAIDFWRSFFRILAPFVVHFWVIFHVLSMLPASLFCYRFCIIFESLFNEFSERRFSENLVFS